MANPYILTANLEIDKLKQIVPILDLVKKIHKPLFIVTKDMSNECLSTVLYNHVKGIVDVTIVVIIKFLGLHDHNPRCRAVPQRFARRYIHSNWLIFI
jgi:chaperonin GroEL (HSP60 family)